MEKSSQIKMDQFFKRKKENYFKNRIFDKP